MAQGSQDRYWARTSTLMWIMFVLWVFFSFVIHFFVGPLNEIKFLGFPLGFYMAAQGSLFIYLALIWYYNRRMRQLDAEHGIDETGEGA